MRLRPWEPLPESRVFQHATSPEAVPYRSPTVLRWLTLMAFAVVTVSTFVMWRSVEATREALAQTGADRSLRVATAIDQNAAVGKWYTAASLVAAICVAWWTHRTLRNAAEIGAAGHPRTAAWCWFVPISLTFVPHHHLRLSARDVGIRRFDGIKLWQFSFGLSYGAWFGYVFFEAFVRATRDGLVDPDVVRNQAWCAAIMSVANTVALLGAAVALSGFDHGVAHRRAMAGGRVVSA